MFFVGSEISLVYQDSEGKLLDDNLITFQASTNDLNWHRIGISVKGDSITLLFDCKKEITKKIHRTSKPKISTDGLIFMGVQLDEDDDYFKVKFRNFLATSTICKFKIVMSLIFLFRGIFKLL